MAETLNREQTLAGCNDKDLRKAFAAAMDEGWTASRTGSGRFKFTHPDASEAVFGPSHVGGLNSIPNFEARLKRALRREPTPPVDQTISEVRMEYGRGLLPDEADEQAVRRMSRWMDEFDMHTSHSHYEGMSAAKLRKHLNDKHQFKRFFGIKIDASLDADACRDIHNIIHGGEAIKERPKPQDPPKREISGEGDAAPDIRQPDPEPPKQDDATGSASSDPSSQDSTEKLESYDEQEERSMGEVVAMKASDEGDGESTERHFGTLQRAVLAVLHEFPGVAMTVEECADLCVDDLDVPQVGGALWRCSRIGGLRVTRVSKGVYRYDPPTGAPNLAVIDRERTGTPTPPAKPRPGVGDPDASSEPRVTMTATGSAGRSEPVGPNDILFEVVLRAEDGSLVLRASDGTVWNAKKI